MLWRASWRGDEGEILEKVKGIRVRVPKNSTKNSVR